MHERKEDNGFDQLMEKLNQTMSRMNELTQILVQRDLGIDPRSLRADFTGSMRGLLEALTADADLLERLVEAVEPDQYLAWLFSVPADSKVFDYRRKYSDQGEEERPN